MRHCVRLRKAARIVLCLTLEFTAIENEAHCTNSSETQKTVCKCIVALDLRQHFVTFLRPTFLFISRFLALLYMEAATVGLL